MKITGYFMAGVLWAGAAGAMVLRRQDGGGECVPGVQKMCEIEGGVRFCCAAEMRCGVIVDQCIRPEQKGGVEEGEERKVVVETKAETTDEKPADTKDESKGQSKDDAEPNDESKDESKAETNATPSSTPSSTSSSKPTSTTSTSAASTSKAAPTTTESPTSNTSSPSPKANEPFLTRTRLIIISTSGAVLLLISLVLTLYVLHRRRKHLDFEGPASAPHPAASKNPLIVSPPPSPPSAPPAYRSETPESPSASGTAEEAIGPLDGMVGGGVGMAAMTAGSVVWPTTERVGAGRGGKGAGRGRGYVKREYQSVRGRGGRGRHAVPVVTVTPPRPARV